MIADYLLNEIINVIEEKHPEIINDILHHLHNKIIENPNPLINAKGEIVKKNSDVYLLTEFGKVLSERKNRK